MTKKEFRQAVNDGLKNIGSRNLETMAADKMACRNVFNYSTWCEINFEKNLREDYTRKTTFTSDLSIAEWYESQEKGAVLDTLRRCLLEWHDNIEYFRGVDYCHKHEVVGTSCKEKQRVVCVLCRPVLHRERPLF